MKISIVVPVYNVEEYLDRCINSICQQTYSDLEIILVDDGSTDNSRKICHKYKEIDDRIIYLYQENSGVSVARNNGISIATGDYIGFVDSDDYIELEMYETLISMCIKYNSELGICGYNNIFPKTGKIVKSDILTETKELDISHFMKEILLGNIKGFLWNKLFRKELFEGILLPSDIYYGEDLYTVINILDNKKDVKIMYSSNTLYNYIQHSSSVTHDITKIFNSSGKLELEETLLKIKSFNFINKEYLEYINISIVEVLTTTYREILLKDNEKKYLHNLIYLRKRMRANCMEYVISRTVGSKRKMLFFLAIYFPTLYKKLYIYKLKGFE